ncbi:hypothetical protein, partial [Klebsiella pneumoniae]|uniref:hypothetical protein n=1 Tax=Klebsiella pneumoniae TaxID=573 RepID=UPI003BF2E6B4
AFLGFVGSDLTWILGAKNRARSLYLYLRDNSGVKNKPQPLCRKGFSVICLKMTLKLFCLEWSR